LLGVGTIALNGYVTSLDGVRGIARACDRRLAYSRENKPKQKEDRPKSKRTNNYRSRADCKDLHKKLQATVYKEEKK
jgi:hypothetical protein